MSTWELNKVKHLIEEYRQNRILWDWGDPDYKDVKKKVELWKKIAVKFDCSVKDAKDKVKNLRTTFHRYRKRRSRSGSAQCNEWVHFASLGFLLEIEAANFENEDVEHQEDDMEKQLDETQYSPDTDDDESVQRRPLEQSTSVKSATFCDTEFATPVSRVKRRRKRGIGGDEEVRSADEVYEILRKTSQRDEFDTYGEHVGNELRNLSSTAQTFAKHHINNILFDAAMGKFDAPSYTQTFSWSSLSSQSSPRPTPVPTSTSPPMPSSLGPHAAPFSISSSFTESEPPSECILPDQ